MFEQKDFARAKIEVWTRPIAGECGYETIAFNPWQEKPLERYESLTEEEARTRHASVLASYAPPAGHGGDDEAGGVNSPHDTP